MEDLKEMFAQMMKFQMESQQKNEEKLLQLQKESWKTRKNNNVSSLNCTNNKKHFLKV